MCVPGYYLVKVWMCSRVLPGKYMNVGVFPGVTQVKHRNNHRVCSRVLPGKYEDVFPGITQ